MLVIGNYLTMVYSTDIALCLTSIVVGFGSIGSSNDSPGVLSTIVRFTGLHLNTWPGESFHIIIIIYITIYMYRCWLIYFIEFYNTV